MLARFGPTKFYVNQVLCKLDLMSTKPSNALGFKQDRETEKTHPLNIYLVILLLIK